MSNEWLKDTQDRFARTQRDFNFQRQEEKELIQNLKEQILNDRKRKYDLLMRKRDDFITENSNQ